MDCASDGVICTKATARHTKMSFSFTVFLLSGPIITAVCSALFRRCTLTLGSDQVPKAVYSVARGGLALFIRCIEIKRTAVVREL